MGVSFDKTDGVIRYDGKLDARNRAGSDQREARE